MNKNEQYMDELRSNLIKVLDSEAKSYTMYAKEIGISNVTLMSFLKNKRPLTRINRIKIELFIKERTADGKNTELHRI